MECPHVNTYNVTRTQSSCAWNTMHYLFVDRSAQGRRKPAVSLEGRNGIMRAYEELCLAVEFGGSNTGLNHGSDMLEEVCKDTIGFPHPFNIAAVL